MSVLLDTGIIYAFLNRDDERNPRSRALIAEVAARRYGAPFVTDHVVDELFTLIRQRSRSPGIEEDAKAFLPLPSPLLKGLTLVSLGSLFAAPTWAVFRKFGDQGLSFTDASLVVTMRELHLDHLATFDAALARLVPSVG